MLGKAGREYKWRRNALDLSEREREAYFCDRAENYIPAPHYLEQNPSVKALIRQRQETLRPMSLFGDTGPAYDTVLPLDLPGYDEATSSVSGVLYAGEPDDLMEKGRLPQMQSFRYRNRHLQRQRFDINIELEL